MKLYPEDPRLSAYKLGELDEKVAAAVKSAVESNPSLQKVVDEAAAMEGLLTKRLKVGNLGLLPEQRENIRRLASSNVPLERASIAGSLGNFKKALLISAAAVVLLLVVMAIFLRIPFDPVLPPIGVQSAPEPALGLEPEPVKPSPSWSPHRSSIKAADFPALELPILAGTGNLELIRKSIQVEENLPAIRAVKLEEILNSFPIRLGGTTAIARSPVSTWHPDSREGVVSSPIATLSSEMMACPWKPSAKLLLISLRGNAANDCKAKLVFRPNSATVLRYRLLGSSSEGGEPISQIISSLPAKAATTLAIEIETSNEDENLGSLEWSADDRAAPSVSVMRNDEAEPSNDARFAALVCTFSQWLAGEQVGFIDEEIVAALARELASGTIEPERGEFLSLVDQSLNLSR